MLKADNPMSRVLMTILIFEFIVYGLSVPVMMMVSNVHPLLASLTGGGAAILALVAAGMLRRPKIGHPLAWLAQAVGIALGLLTPGMIVMGLVFTALYAISFVLGRKIEANQADATR